MPSKSQEKFVKDQQSSQYINYSNDNSYSYNAGMLVLPVAGPDGSAPRIIKTHASIGMRKMEFSTSKSGAPPWVPAIATNTQSGDIFLGGTINAPLPEISSNQSEMIYAMHGSYMFVQPGAPRGVNDVFDTSEYPFQLPLISFMSAFDTLANNSSNGSVQWAADDDTNQSIESNEPNWDDASYTWRDMSIPGFFMSADLLS